MSKNGFGLVIFDCDGVLVDSELITNRVFARMLNELGIAVTLGYCALTPKQRLIEAGAHHTFERMRDLPGLLSGAG